MESKIFIGQWSGKQQHPCVGRICLKAHMLICILHHYPFVATISKMFTDTMNTSSLDAQLHQLVSNLCCLTLSLASKTDHKGDHLTLNLFKYH